MPQFLIFNFSFFIPVSNSPALHIIPLVVGVAHREGLSRKAAVASHRGEQISLFHSAEKESEISFPRRERTQLVFAVNVIGIRNEALPFSVKEGLERRDRQRKPGGPG